MLGASAIAQARELDAEIAAGVCRGPLHGIPISLKDLIDQQGVPTTAASRVREGHVAARDAPVTARLREAGAVLIGKTNLHEFAFGTTSDDTAFGAVRNPHDPSRSPGGSSGGSAVGIVTGMSVASIGTDTGGSIRIPSAACGTVGLKPTWGEVPCEGVVPLSQSLDHVGPLARSVADAWLIYLVLRGEATAARWPLPAPRPVKGLRLGVPRHYFHDVLDDEVRARFAACSRVAAPCRAPKRWTSSSPTRPASRRSISTHRSRKRRPITRGSLESAPERYTKNVRLRLEMGRYVLAEDYVRAQAARAVLRARSTPRSPAATRSCCRRSRSPRRRLAHPPSMSRERRQAVRSMMLRMTQFFNLTGHPAVSIPMGETAAGLPCGLQLAGRLNDTEGLLAAAAACEPLIIE